MKLHALESEHGEFDRLTVERFEALARKGADALVLAFRGGAMEKGAKPFPRDGTVDALGELGEMLTKAYADRVEMMARAAVAAVRGAAGPVPMALRKSGGPFIGPRGGKWADAQHTVPWHEGVDHYAVHGDAHHAVRDVAVVAAHRAAAAGADAPSLKYVGAGAEGVIFTDKTGRAYKVGRSADRESLRAEHDAGAVLAEHGLGPKVHKFDAKHGVIVRDHVDGRPGRWSEGADLRKRYDAVVGVLHAADFTAPEFKEDSFIVDEAAGAASAKMIDVGFARPRGKRLAAELRKRPLEAATGWDASFDAQMDINHAFEDGALTHEEAVALISRIGNEGQRAAGLDILGMKGKRLAKATHRVPVTTHPVEMGPPPANGRKTFPHHGVINFQGLRILVENVKGSHRSGTDGDGHEWRVKMHAHYGEIAGTEGTDGDRLDVYVGDNADSPLAVVVHQQNPQTKAYDEDKVMLGFDTVADALAVYRKQYDRPGFYGGHEAMPIGRLLRWAKDPANRGTRVRKGSSFAALIRAAAGRAP